MKEYRYFITDNTNVGTLVSGGINGKEMLLLLGRSISYNESISCTDIVRLLCKEYSFKIIIEKLTFAELNTSPETPYTYYDLVDENGYCEPDGYMYANINDISKHFSSKTSIKMLRSIQGKKHKPFS